MTLQTFESSLPVTAVLQHYTQWWSMSTEDARRDSRVHRQADWQVLALTSDRLYVTVHAQPRGGGSQGTVAVSRNPADVRLSLTTSFPHPRGTHVVNLQEYEDPGATAEHISLVSSRPASMSAREFAQLLSRDGWSVYRQGDAQAIARGHIIEAQRGAELAHLTFAPSSGSRTTIVVIWTKG